MTRALSIALLLFPVLAFAQDGGRKFDLKKLEQEFAPMPVYYKKGAVVGNEVIVNHDQVKDAYRAVYVVKADAKKVVEFYKEKTSVEPRKKGDEMLDDVKYTFVLPAREGDKRIYRVIVSPIGKNKAQIALWHRAVTDSDELLDDEE